MIQVAPTKTLTDPPEPGVYSDVPDTAYFSWDCASNSQLSDIHEHCPAVARHAFMNPKQPTDEQLIGTYTHCLALEPERFAREFAIGPDVNLNKKDGKDQWTAFCNANPGKTHIRGE